MVTLFIASFNRASDGALSILKKGLRKRDMIANIPEYASHILAVGDRTETYDCVLEQYRNNKQIIHLWAGEIDSLWCIHDDVYRHSMTLMSCMQLCTNEDAKKRVELICKAVDKKPNAYVVGNIMLDDLSIDNSIVPKEKFILVLYNPISLSDKETKKDIDFIYKMIDKYKGYKLIWIEPNSDKNSDLVTPFVTHKTLPRKQFLALVKNCSLFITNSSCQYYEAQFLLHKSKIVPIGRRNIERESKYADMSMKGATERIIELLESIK